uniref:Protein phosphatase 1 regulatory subunit 14 n=1 Tax=Monodelphis domestica TaxID=13616 RepID=F7G690_MONDO
MSVATGSSEPASGAGGGGSRVFFQSPRAGSGGGSGSSSSAGSGCSTGSGSSREDSAPTVVPAVAGQVQQQQRRHQQGKVTVKYDRKELRKRLVLEEWIVEQLGQLYGCEEEEMPDVEIDIDDLLDADSEEERALKLQEALVDCYKPTEEFIKELLSRIRGMRKLSPPQKKDLFFFLSQSYQCFGCSTTVNGRLSNQMEEPKGFDGVVLVADMGSPILRGKWEGVWKLIEQGERVSYIDSLVIFSPSIV